LEGFPMGGLGVLDDDEELLDDDEDADDLETE
jgi:hypothetical protein